MAGEDPGSWLGEDETEDAENGNESCKGEITRGVLG